MTMIRYTPNRWANPFDRIFSDFLPTGELPDHEAESFVPRVDIRDQEEAIILSAEFPGVDKDSIKVEVDNRVLTLSGEKVEDIEAKENGFYRSERVYGAFKRSFSLPETVDGEKIQATYNNGVLRLALPKKPEAKPRLIDIQAGQSDVRQVEVS